MASQKLIFQGLLVLVSVICIVHSTKTIYDGSNIPKHGKIIEANYTPRGEEYQIGNLTVYETPNGSGKRVLIHIYDILGMSTNIRQVADSIADIHGFRVVIPRIFREEYWNSENFPIADQEEVDAWVEQYASWNGVAKPDVQNIINHFRTTENITEFGIFGMCYGGLISTMAATEINEVKAAGWVHPTYVTTEMANDVKVPMCLLPTLNDPDYIPFYEILKSKFGDAVYHRRFSDMMHAFSGAGGDFSNPLIQQRVEEAVDLGIVLQQNTEQLELHYNVDTFNLNKIVNFIYESMKSTW
ncbi:putative AIM2 family protein C30D10.14 [Orchesella cincta]|uniref:Putative AIM2 family protein C30D10.14 n=1 Tax=Orchesella cincta TaxID=48709 RepID=A0A1D2MY18_ORCCI|nr:putative AIM2 family protein C30D10.14 [Orchesella cincta]